MNDLIDRLGGVAKKVMQVAQSDNHDPAWLGACAGILQEMVHELRQLKETPMGKFADKIHDLRKQLSASQADAAHNAQKAGLYDAAVAGGRIADDADFAALTESDTLPGDGGTDTTVAGTGTDTTVAGGGTDTVVGGTGTTVTTAPTLPAGLIVQGDHLATADGRAVYTKTASTATVANPAAWPIAAGPDNAQIVFNGEPLYTFTGDAPGSVTGDGADGGTWHKVAAPVA